MAQLKPGRYRAGQLFAVHPATGLPIYATRCGNEILGRHVAQGENRTHTKSGLPVYAFDPCVPFPLGRHLGALIGQHAGQTLLATGCLPCAAQHCFCDEGSRLLFLTFDGAFQDNGLCPHAANLPRRWVMQREPGSKPPPEEQNWYGWLDGGSGRSFVLCGAFEDSVHIRWVEDRWQIDLVRYEFSTHQILATYLEDRPIPGEDRCVFVRVFQNGIIAPPRAYLERPCRPCGLGLDSVKDGALCSLELLDGDCTLLNGAEIAIFPFERVGGYIDNNEYWWGYTHLSPGLGPPIVAAWLGCWGNNGDAGDYELRLTMGYEYNTFYWTAFTNTRPPARLLFSSRDPFMLVYEVVLDRGDPPPIGPPLECSGRVRATLTKVRL